MEGFALDLHTGTSTGTGDRIVSVMGGPPADRKRSINEGWVPGQWCRMPVAPLVHRPPALYDEQGMGLDRQGRVNDVREVVDRGG